MKKYIKIEGIFKPDLLNVTIKTSQIKYINLYNKKKLINNIIEDNNFIDTKFSKSYLRHCYLGDLYSLSGQTFFDKMDSDYKKTMDLTNSTFLRIMKKFISKKYFNKRYV